MKSASARKCLPLRHAVATLGYRAAKTVRDAPSDFAHFRAGDSTRTAGEILAHMEDLIKWAISICDGKERWRQSKPAAWGKLVARFFAALKKFDDRLASAAELAVPAEKLFQGPIADALTHVGQIATLRRLAGDGIRGENYFKANIAIGCVGLDQPPAVREFD
jgi:hypothetical protein